MGNNRNRKRKKARNLPSKKATKFKMAAVCQKRGGCDQNPGPSKIKIDDVSVNCG
jgi:hypothetical protein